MPSSNRDACLPAFPRHKHLGSYVAVNNYFRNRKAGIRMEWFAESFIQMKYACVKPKETAYTIHKPKILSR